MLRCIGGGYIDGGRGLWVASPLVRPAMRCSTFRVNPDAGAGAGSRSRPHRVLAGFTDAAQEPPWGSIPVPSPARTMVVVVIGSLGVEVHRARVARRGSRLRLAVRVQLGGVAHPDAGARAHRRQPLRSIRGPWPARMEVWIDMRAFLSSGVEQRRESSLRRAVRFDDAAVARARRPAVLGTPRLLLQFRAHDEPRGSRGESARWEDGWSGGAQGVRAAGVPGSRSVGRLSP